MDVYVKPKNRFKLKENQLLKLLKPLYELSESGDYCHITMKNHLVNDPKMHPLAGDLAYFIRIIHGRLSGMIGTYVDDFIEAGNDYFVEQNKLTGRKFTAKNKKSSTHSRLQQ